MGIGIKTFFQGRIARDPELRTTQDGTEVCSFSVAVNQAFQKDKDNKKADFIDCTAWRGLGAAISKYFHKGDGIAITGDLTSRKWEDKDGKNRISWEVTVSEFEFPLNRSGGAAQSSGTASDAHESFEVADNSEPLPF